MRRLLGRTIFAAVVVALLASACYPVTAPAVPPTDTPAPTPTPIPFTPEPALPDAKTDPTAALLYSGQSGQLNSAEFHFEMNMTMAPEDDRSKEALGAAAAMLSQLEIKILGVGALAVKDAATGKADMRMDMQMAALGRSMALNLVMLDGKLWMREGEDAEWQVQETGSAAEMMPAGFSPEEMLAMFEDATDVRWVEDVVLDGEPVRRLRFSVDPSALDLAALTRTLQGAAGAADLAAVQEMMKTMTVDVDVWLAAADLSLRQQQAMMTLVMPAPAEFHVPDARLRFTIQMLMKMDKLNGPVIIEAPVVE